MRFSADCMTCLAQGEFKHIQGLGNDDSRAAYMRKVMLAIGSAPPECSSPMMHSVLIKMFEETWNLSALRYEKEKVLYNELMLKKEPALQQMVLESDDPLPLAIKLARAGNYIDFGAKAGVEEDTLDEMIRKAISEELDPEMLARFTTDLEKAKSISYLTDNCGEIVMDKILVKTLTRLYPNAKLTVVVRGEPVLNDATMADAIAVGMDKLAPVVGSGSGIAGTQLTHVSPEVHDLLTHSDVIVSKGMGNFESLAGCGLNVYYLFLCKCAYFERRFKLPLLTGTFLWEREHDSNYWNML